MKSVEFIVAILFLLILISTPVSADSDLQAAPLVLRIKPGAKQAAMGEAYSALADDALAGYYNPAGLAFHDKTLKNLQFMHTKWLPQLAEDMFFEYLGYSQYAEGWGHFAFNIAFLNAGEQYRTSEHSAEVIGTFDSFDLVASGSYGAMIKDNLSLGITLKGIYSNLGEQGQGGEGKGIGSSFAFDFGCFYRTSIKNLTLSAVIHNLGPKISYVDVTQADPLPLNLVVGSAYIPIDKELSKLTFVFDIYKPLVRRHGSAIEALYKAWYDDDEDEFKQMDFRLGTEYVYNNFLALRLGYTYDYDGDLKSPTFGVGIIYERINFDVAYYGVRDNPNQDSTRFSAGYSF
jgi:hypothetical protein